ncbi:MAG: response regulator, partial [Acidobacteriaceae bacterium]
NDNQPRKQKKRFFKKSKNQQQGQNQGQNQGQSPGNSRAARADSRGNTNQQQQRRGSKQRKPKVFVGPMDHSYRAANGNYADSPPSTIELQRGYTNVHYNGNGNGNFNGNYAGPSRQLDGVDAEANAALAENSPTRIYCFIDDLFFMAKIQETSRKLGIKVAFVKNDKETIADLLALPDEERPALIVFDLNNVSAKPLTLIPKLKLKLKRATSIVGFLSHLQGELKAKAIEAGCDSVMPRSAFSQTLPNLLRRYGIEAEPELDDSQAMIIEA